jgi:pimeloyl-ACP methyl ester carboxylesterase
MTRIPTIYEPPVTIPAAAGVVVGYSPLRHAPAGALGWRVAYVTNDRKGGEWTIATASVFVADEPAQERPILVYGHPTSGIERSCAPSLQGHPGRTLPGLSRVLADGWIYVAPDYPGLGGPGLHEYLHGHQAGWAMLDAITATQHLPIGASSKAALWGWSQGAHAALWAAHFDATTPDSSRDLIGVAAGAPPADLPRIVAATLGTSGGRFLMPFASVSWGQMYDIPLEDIVREKDIHLVRKLASLKLLGASAMRAHHVAQKLPVDFLKVNPLTTDPWREVLRANIPPTQVAAPLYIAQGDEDEIVPAHVTEDTVRAYRKAGASVETLVVRGRGHVAGELASARTTLGWLTERLQGVRLAS